MERALETIVLRPEDYLPSPPPLDIVQRYGIGIVGCGLAVAEKHPLTGRRHADAHVRRNRAGPLQWTAPGKRVAGIEPGDGVENCGGIVGGHRE